MIKTSSALVVGSTAVAGNFLQGDEAAADGINMLVRVGIAVTCSVVAYTVSYFTTRGRSEEDSNPLLPATDLSGTEDSLVTNKSSVIFFPAAAAAAAAVVVVVVFGTSYYSATSIFLHPKSVSATSSISPLMSFFWDPRNVIVWIPTIQLSCFLLSFFQTWVCVRERESSLSYPPEEEALMNLCK